MEAVEEDDDLFVVIVEDEVEDDPEMLKANLRKQVFKVKEEIQDEDSEPSSGTIQVEDLIETAEKHGQLISLDRVKQEPRIKEEPQDTEYLDFELVGGDSDEEYVPNEEEYSEGEVDTIDAPKTNSKTVSEGHRYRLRKPEERQSFVKELKEQYPELEEDKELLVETLCEIMLQDKAPPLPPDIFVMNDIMFECVTCGSMKDSIPALERHWQEKHGPRYLVCYSCGVDFRSRTNLYKHEKRCASPDAVWVLKARALSLGRKARSRPFIPPPEQRPLKSKEKMRFHCSHCTAEFATKQSLRSHELAHLGTRPYRCSHCPAAYTSHTGLNRHVRLKHSDEVYICDTCSRPFKSKSSLIVHMNTHQPERPYPCSFCGRRYAQRMARRLHEDRTHRHLPPPCACRICPKRYPRMSLLKTHMLREHGMNLITRKMFYKALPHLSETQLKEAMVVRKSSYKEDQQVDEYCLQTKALEQSIDDMIARSKKDKETSKKKHEFREDGDHNYDFMKHFTKIGKGDITESAQVIVIQNGELICVDDSNMHLYKDQLTGLRNQYKSEDIKIELLPQNSHSKPKELKPIKVMSLNNNLGSKVTITNNKKKSQPVEQRKGVRKRTLKKFEDHV